MWRRLRCGASFFCRMSYLHVMSAFVIVKPHHLCKHNELHFYFPPIAKRTFNNYIKLLKNISRHYSELVFISVWLGKWTCDVLNTSLFSINSGCLTSLIELFQELYVIMEEVLWGKLECSSWSLLCTDNVVWLQSARDNKRQDSHTTGFAILTDKVITRFSRPDMDWYHIHAIFHWAF